MTVAQTRSRRRISATTTMFAWAYLGGARGGQGQGAVGNGGPLDRGRCLVEPDLGHCVSPDRDLPGTLVRVSLHRVVGDVQDQVAGRDRAAGRIGGDGCGDAKRSVAGRLELSGVSPAVLTLPTDQNSWNRVPRACVRPGGASWQRDGGNPSVTECLDLRRFAGAGDGQGESAG